jgi:hypothetical protein
MESTSSSLPTSSQSLSTMKPSSTRSDSDTCGHEEPVNAAAVMPLPFFNVAPASPKVTSSISIASALRVVSTVQIRGSSDAESSNASQNEVVAKKPRKQFVRSCTHCRNCMEFERATTCDGRIGNKVCPYKAAAISAGEEMRD